MSRTASSERSVMDPRKRPTVSCAPGEHRPDQERDDDAREAERNEPQPALVLDVVLDAVKRVGAAPRGS